MALKDLVSRIIGKAIYLNLTDEHMGVLLRIEHFDVVGFAAGAPSPATGLDEASLMMADPRKIVDLEKRGLVTISEPPNRRAGMVQVALTGRGLDVIRWYEVTRFASNGIPARFGITPGGLHVSLV